MISPKYIHNIFIVILCIFIVFVIYIFIFYSFNENIERDTEEWAVKLQDHKIESLVNGSSIHNIPNLNIITPNQSLIKANLCQQHPIHIGAFGTDQDCVRTCANSSATVIQVKPNEMYVYDTTTLKPGANCIIGRKPECNMKTTYALMTINSIICRSKFPKLVGGPLGTTVVACNNHNINDPQNYLWDYKFDQKFNPLTTIINDADERLPDGSYRFRCKFNGVDVKNNYYIAHPQDRFHPIRNYCASEIYSAHPNIKTVFDESGNFTCDCGDFQQMRVKNIYPDDPSSFCSSVQYENKHDVKERHLLTLPYKCFTLFSPISDVGKYLPCPNDVFTRQGSNYNSIKIPYSYDPKVAIEHPKYAEMKTGRVIPPEIPLPNPKYGKKPPIYIPDPIL